MKPKAVVIIGVCLFAALCIATLMTLAGRIELDLAKRTTRALAASGLDAVDVALDGRDVTLTGAVGEPTAEAATSLAATVWGVRVVESDIDTAAAERARIAEQERLAQARRLARQAREEAARQAELARLARAARLAEQERLAAARQAELARAEEARRLAEEQAQREAARKAAAARDAAQRHSPGAGAHEATPAAAVTAERSKASPTARCDESLQALLAGMTIQFDTDGAEIPPHGMGLLNAVSASARDCPGVRIEVIGYTDTRGAREANLALSRQRAEAAVSALTSLGVARERLVATGHGAQTPLASNATAEGRARNRRVEFHVTQ